VATRIVAKKPEMRIEDGKLRIPHGETRSEGVGENENRCGFRARQRVMDADVA